MSFSLVQSHRPRRAWLLHTRTERLTSLRTRRRLAAGLRRALAAAESPPHPFSAVVPVQRLLTDANSPLYLPGPEGELDRALRHAHAALLLR
jgi:hypothetical protein